MELFDIRNVYLDWDDTLDGKEVFVSDDLKKLRDYVNENNEEYYRTVRKNPSILSSEVNVRPYKDMEHGSSWGYCYYDPLYEYKWAYAQGKKVQWLDDDGEWRNCTKSCLWHDDYEYRIVEEEIKRLTHGQLSQWLAQGNGQYKCRDDTLALCSFIYREHVQELFVEDTILVRKWGDVMWHEPTVEYCFGEGRCQEE